MGRKGKNQKQLKSIVVCFGSFSQEIQLDTKENILDIKDLEKLRKMKTKYKKMRKSMKKVEKSPKDSATINKSNENTSKNIFQLDEKEMQDFYLELKEESSLFL